MAAVISLRPTCWHAATTIVRSRKLLGHKAAGTTIDLHPRFPAATARASAVRPTSRKRHRLDGRYTKTIESADR